MGGWLETDNRAISDQLNLTGTASGTELGNTFSVRGGWVGGKIIPRIRLTSVKDLVEVEAELGKNCSSLIIMISVLR